MARVGLSLAAGVCLAQTPVPVGSGSYASTVPPDQGPGLKALHAFTNLFVVPGATGRPIPSNQWWTDLITRRYCGELWAHPLTVSADTQGINVFFPAGWNADGSHLQPGPPLRIGGEVNRPPDTTVTVLADFEGAELPAGWTATGDAFRGLGSALGDRAMTAAGAMGYAMEEQATREYWFDVHATNLPAAYGRSITGILFGNGQAYATYFSGDPAWIHGIQWLPMTPLLDYLARDPAFARRDFEVMMTERKTKEGRTDLASMGTGLGNVVLSYAALFDPDWAAAQFDQLWAANSPVAHDRDTPGMTYYRIHAGRSLGRRQWDWHMDLPTSAVYFNDKTRAYSYVAFNPTASPVTARVFKQGHPAGTLSVPANSLVRTAELKAIAGGVTK